MAQGVIHALEIVEVEHHDSYFFLIPLGLGQGNAQAIVEELPVGKTRQGIMVGHLPDLFLRLLTLGDVSCYSSKTDNLSFLVLQREPCDFGKSCYSILTNSPKGNALSLIHISEPTRRT